MKKTANRRKILVTAVCLIMAASVIAAAACTTLQLQEKSVFEQVAELAAGVAVNLVLGWHVWDYSAQPLNLFGQICPRFSFYWLCLSYAACGALRLARRTAAQKAQPEAVP